MSLSVPAAGMASEAGVLTRRTSCPSIRASQVAVRYGGRTVLEEVTLEMKGGGITAIVGPSGCGKTSFLNCINRLCDLSPGCRPSGQLWVGSQDVLARDVDLLELRGRVGMICQRPNPFPFSIRKNFELPLREHGIRDRARLEGIMEQVLRDVGLLNEVKDRLDGPALALSGGQQQRLCFARALALQPEVLLMDEPCSALDPLSSGILEDLVVGLRKRCTVVIVTHNLAQARRIADDTAVFWNEAGRGYLLDAGTVAQVFEAPSNPLTAAYIRGLRG